MSSNGSNLSSASSNSEYDVPKYTTRQFLDQLGFYENTMVDMSLFQLLHYAKPEYEWIWNEQADIISVFQRRGDRVGQLLGKAVASSYVLYCTRCKLAGVPIIPGEPLPIPQYYGFSDSTTSDRSPSPDFITFTNAGTTSDPEYIIISDDSDSESMDTDNDDTDEDLANSAIQLLHIEETGVVPSHPGLPATPVYTIESDD